MSQTKTKSRAAYLRAYRARKAGPAPTHRCPQCHTAFLVERTDARYCSEACRAAAWRAITHRHITHRPDGWVIPANRSGAGEREPCAFERRETDRQFCGRPATWLGLSGRNYPHGISLTYRCEEHCPPAMRTQTCDPDASCHHGARCPAKEGVAIIAPPET